MAVNVLNISTSGFDEDALTTATAGDFILNFGKLTTTGDLAEGIFAMLRASVNERRGESGPISIF